MMRWCGTNALPSALTACLFVALASSCTFDSSKLEARECGQGARCEEGKVCCNNYCVLAAGCVDAAPPDTVAPDQGVDIDPTVDGDLDGVANEEDNCPQDYNPGQQDADKDNVGDICDCAPTDETFSATTVDIATFAGPVPFTPVEQVANWRVVGSAYRQAAASNLQRSLHELEAHTDFRTTVRFKITEDGNDGLSFPPDDKNRSLAGVFVRAAGTDQGKGDAYYCALDLSNRRLILGKSAADNIGNSVLQLFSEGVGSEPGKEITGETSLVQINTAYTLTLRVVGDALSCKILLPNNATVEFTTTDTEVTSGGFGLFTAGAATNFEAVKVCAKK